LAIHGLWKAKDEFFGGRKRLALIEGQKEIMSGYGVANGNLIPYKNQKRRKEE